MGFYAGDARARKKEVHGGFEIMRCTSDISSHPLLRGHSPIMAVSQSASPTDCAETGILVDARGQQSGGHQVKVGMKGKGSGNQQPGRCHGSFPQGGCRSHNAVRFLISGRFTAYARLRDRSSAVRDNCCTVDLGSQRLGVRTMRPNLPARDEAIS
jgi:hypothetical protein